MSKYLHQQKIIFEFLCYCRDNYYDDTLKLTKHRENNEFYIKYNKKEITICIRNHYIAIVDYTNTFFQINFDNFDELKSILNRLKEDINSDLKVRMRKYKLANLLSYDK